jgi:transketolase
MALDMSSLRLRRLIVEAMSDGSTAHLGPALSLVEILRALYEHYLRTDPRRPDWPDRDRLILSKGHGCLALYAVLADMGFIGLADLQSFGLHGSILTGHPERGAVPGVEASTGSLGHGLPIAVGMALAARIRGSAYRVVVVTGDGELNEGSNWEAALHAGKHRLDGLSVFVDRNGWQCFGRSDEVADLHPLAEKFRSFGFATAEVDGHSMDELRRVASRLPLAAGRPSAVICHTTKGKGISAAEDSPAWHHLRVSDETIREMRQALDVAVFADDDDAGVGPVAPRNAP